MAQRETSCVCVGSRLTCSNVVDASVLNTTHCETQGVRPPAAAAAVEQDPWDMPAHRNRPMRVVRSLLCPAVLAPLPPTQHEIHPALAGRPDLTDVLLPVRE